MLIPNANCNYDNLDKTCDVVENCLRMTDTLLNQYFYQIEYHLVRKALPMLFHNENFTLETKKYIYKYLNKSNLWEKHIFPKVKIKLEKYFGVPVNIFVSSEEIAECLSNNDFVRLNHFFAEANRSAKITRYAAQVSIKAWDYGLSCLPISKTIDPVDHMKITQLIPSLLELDTEDITSDSGKMIELLVQGLLTNVKLRVRHIITKRIAEHSYRLHDRIFGPPTEHQRAQEMTG
ncbi:MAG: hypothetical protein AAGU27_04085 [Dehalobacterium sp.]